MRSTVAEPPELVSVQPGATPYRLLSDPDGIPARLRPFRIGRYPVTNAEYLAYIRSASTVAAPPGWKERNTAPGTESHPVLVRAATDAEAYCRWLSNVLGGTYRLPQEAEWEFAAAGRDHNTFPWGDMFDPEACDSRERGLGHTCPVDAHPRGASWVGCLDMAGNAGEFCADIYREQSAPEASGGLDADGALSRVVRGGSFRCDAHDVRCVSRRPAGAFDGLGTGFRVCLS